MTVVTGEQFADLIRGCDTAFRWEARPFYRTSAAEGEALTRFLANDPPIPDEYSEWREWLDTMRELTAQGKQISRVRVTDDPPTDYQRWAMQAARYHLEAGEDIRFLPRATAVNLGIIAPGDWWLFNGTALVSMAFTDGGEVEGMTLVTRPAIIRRHRQWRVLALRHATAAEHAVI